MTVKHYEDIDYTIEVPEPLYNALVQEATRMKMFGDNGIAAVRNDIDRAHFRYSNFGRTPELETEIVGRTIVFEEMF